MKRNRYSEDEIILCTYIARFGRDLIDEELIRCLFDRRPVGSVKMKVQNIARMLSEEGYRHSQEVSPWGGGHRSNWHTVQPYADRAEPDFTALVKEMLASGRQQSEPARKRDHQQTPDMLRQSEGFERVHENLGVFLIATPVIVFGSVARRIPSPKSGATKLTRLSTISPWRKLAKRES